VPSGTGEFRENILTKHVIHLFFVYFLLQQNISQGANLQDTMLKLQHLSDGIQYLNIALREGEFHCDEFCLVLGSPFMFSLVSVHSSQKPQKRGFISTVSTGVE